MRYDAAALGIGFAVFRERIAFFQHRHSAEAKKNGYQFVELSASYSVLRSWEHLAREGVGFRSVQFHGMINCVWYSLCSGF